MLHYGGSGAASRATGGPLIPHGWIFFSASIYRAWRRFHAFMAWRLEVMNITISESIPRILRTSGSVKSGWDFSLLYRLHLHIIFSCCISSSAVNWCGYLNCDPFFHLCQIILRNAVSFMVFFIPSPLIFLSFSFFPTVWCSILCWFQMMAFPPFI